MKHVVYLHGYPSSPQSSKARVLADKFAAHPDIAYHAPDLNVPSFDKATLSAMIAETDHVIDPLAGQRVVLVGSSMGGLTALHYLDRYRADSAQQVSALVLLAPAFDVFADQEGEFSPQSVSQWAADGYKAMHHYSFGQTFNVHYGLVEDLRQYDSYRVQIPQPILIFHGKRDRVVDPQQSVLYAERYSNVRLIMPETDHQMHDQTDAIYAEILRLLA